MAPRQRNTDAVWIDVLPALMGFGAELAKEAAGSGSKAGKQLAIELERAAEKAGKDAGKRLGDGIAAAEARVDQLGAALRNARDKEADAAGKVRIAEEKLNEVRAKGEKAAGSSIAAAEEALATARRRNAAATTQIERAERDLADAEKDVAAAQRDAADAERDAANAREDHSETLQRAREQLDTYADRLGHAARQASSFGLNSVRAASATAAIGSATPIVGGLVTALTQASGAALILPGALLAGGIAAGVLKLGVSGLSDALSEWDDPEKFAEAIEELSPAGQAAAIAIRDLRPELIELRNAVQDSILAGFADEVETLGRAYLPLLKDQLADVGEQFGDTRSDLAAFLADARTVDDVSTLITHTETAVGDLSGALVPLTSAFRDVAVVGSDVFTDFTASAGGAAQGVADFFAEARAGGDLEAWIRNGIAVAGQFLGILGDIGQIVSTVLSAADQQGAGILNTISAVTGSVVALLHSPEGHEALLAFFGAVHAVVQALLPGLQAVGGAVIDGVIELAPELPGVASAFTAVVVAIVPLVPPLARLAAEILPLLTDRVIALVPAVELVVGWISQHLVPALTATVQWIQRNMDWLVPLFVVLGTGAVVYKTIAIATDLWAKRTLIMAAAQWALNTAMSANPVGLIIAAVVALVAGFVYLWNTSEGFRGFWIGLWEAIKTAAMWVWDNALKPAFAGIVTAVTAVGTAAMWLWREAIQPAAQAIGAAATWLWSSVLQPVFSFIDTAVRILAAVIITVFVTPGVLAFKALAAVAMWVWSHAIKPAFDAIAAAAMWLWSTVLKPFVDLNIAAFRLLASVAMWLWLNGIKPAFDAIAFAANWLWSNVIKPVVDFHVAAFQMLAGAALWLWNDGIKIAFDAIAVAANWLWSNVIKPVVDLHVAAFQLVASTALWLWTNAIQPAFDGIGSVVRWVWDNIISPVFASIKTGVDAVGGAFDSAVGWIGRTWDSLKAKLADPVNFLINFVYNDGIRAVWNKVAGFVGVSELPRVDPIKFAGGGFVVPGYAPGVDNTLSLLSPGEAVLVPELTRAIGPGNIMAANYAASGRRGTVAGGGGVARFAGGGVVGDLLGWVPGIGDDLKALWNNPRGWVTSRLGGASGLADLIAAIPEKLIGSAVDWLSEKMSSFFSSTAGSGDLGKWIAAAMQITGVPANWAGPLNTLIMRESGGNPNARNDWDINARNGVPSQGLMQTIPPTFAAYRDPRLPNNILDPVANIVAGIRYIKARYGTIFNVQQAVGATPLGYDQGGYLQPGLQLVYNGTRRPERVLTDDQWEHLGGQSLEGLSLVGAVVEVRDDGLIEFVDGRIERANQNTGSALARRTR